jgi:hypothetical protein
MFIPQNMDEDKAAYFSNKEPSIETSTFKEEEENQMKNDSILSLAKFDSHNSFN